MIAVGIGIVTCAQTLPGRLSERALTVADGEKESLAAAASVQNNSRLGMRPVPTNESLYKTRLPGESPSRVAVSDVDLSTLPDLYGTRYYTAQTPNSYPDGGLFRFPNPENSSFKILANGMAS